MSTVDRMADGYEPRFDIDMEVGRQGEIFITSVIDSLKDGASVETKTDVRALQTGNIYVEFECFRLGQWRKSGIATTEAEVWVFVLGVAALCIPTETLKVLARLRWHAGGVREQPRGSHPTKGVIIPIPWLLRELANQAKAAA